MASGNPKDGAVKIHQDADLYAGVLENGKEMDIPVQKGHVWLQVARGAVGVEGAVLTQGDGAAIEKVAAHAHVASATSVFFINSPRL